MVDLCSSFQTESFTTNHHIQPQHQAFDDHIYPRYIIFSVRVIEEAPTVPDIHKEFLFNNRLSFLHAL